VHQHAAERIEDEPVAVDRPDAVLLGEQAVCRTVSK
jgi:hypothetical protein